MTVYLFGEEIWSGSKVLKYDEVWDVGRVLWPEGEFVRDNVDVYTAAVRSCR